MADSVGKVIKSLSSVEDIKTIIDMIPTPEGVLQFLYRFGKELGRGSSRSAFEYAPGRVLKIAFNRAGVAQNKIEIENNKQLMPFVPEMYDYHPSGYWADVEKVSLDYMPGLYSFIHDSIKIARESSDPFEYVASEWENFNKIKEEYYSKNKDLEF